MKQVIRLTESDLHRIIENCVKRALNEDSNGKETEWWEDYDQWMDTVWTNNEDGKELSDRWHRKLIDKYPNKDKRARAFNNHCEKRDRIKAKKAAEAKKRQQQYDQMHS